MKTPEERAAELWYRIWQDLSLDKVTPIAVFVIDEIIAEFKLMVPDPYKQHYKYLEEVKKELISYEKET